jgi:hypothetical protein
VREDDPEAPWDRLDRGYLASDELLVAVQVRAKLN